jgi:hypothetical protein
MKMHDNQLSLIKIDDNNLNFKKFHDNQVETWWKPGGNLVETLLDAPAVFNGNLAHEVEDYDGEERFSVILFTHGKYHKAKADEKEELEAAGCEWPTIQKLQALAKWDPAGITVDELPRGKKVRSRAGALRRSASRIKPLKTRGKRRAKEQPDTRSSGLGGSASSSKQSNPLIWSEGAAGLPQKRPRREIADTDKNWVCPFAGCMHRIVSGAAGQNAHIARCHRGHV